MNIELRDFLAAHAPRMPIEWWFRASVCFWTHEKCIDMETIWRYMYADKMLKARDSQQPKEETR